MNPVRGFFKLEVLEQNYNILYAHTSKHNLSQKGL